MKQLLWAFAACAGLLFVVLMLLTALMSPLGDRLPKSARLAFMGSVMDNLDVYVADLSRGLVVRFTRGETWERYPAWSPDGKYIAYHSGPARQPGCTINYEIFISSLDGRTVRQITGSNLDSFQSAETIINGGIYCAAMPDWSPDGEKIAFHANPAGHWDIFVYNLTTDELTRVTDSLDDDVLFDWAADSKHGVMTTGPSSLMILSWLNTETGEVTPLTSFEALLDENGILMTPSGTLEDWHPTLSPDGTQVVFMSDRSGGANIYTMNTDGTDVKHITDDFYSDSNPIWTTDGRIIFTSDRSGPSRLFSVKPDGSDLRVLFGMDAGFISDGAAWWSPDLVTAAPALN